MQILIQCLFFTLPGHCSFLLSTSLKNHSELSSYAPVSAPTDLLLTEQDHYAIQENAVFSFSNYFTFVQADINWSQIK